MKRILDVLGVTEWHRKGFTGKGIKFLELESPNSSHGRGVIDDFKIIGIDANAKLMRAGYHVKNGKLDKDSELIKTVDYCIENKVDIVGVSKEGTNNKEVINQYKRLIDAGVILITSAGNDNKDIDKTNSYAKSDVFISVGAIFWNEDFKKIKKKSYSNWGQDLDFVMPILSNREGTSFSAPALSGIIALILQRYGKMNQQEIYKLLQSISVDLGKEGFDELFGYGMPVLPAEINTSKPIKEENDMLDIKCYDGQITRNFNIYEFKCNDNGEALLNEKVINHIQRLQKFREWYNRPMRINSGYRTVDYNKKIGGSPKSQHLQGLAADIALPNEFYKFTKQRQKEFLNNIKSKWIQLCKAGGVKGGIGFYDTFVHLDSREGTGAISFWDERK